jgi:hypothetical protein
LPTKCGKVLRQLSTQIKCNYFYVSVFIPMEAFLFLGRHSVSISEASFLIIYLDSAELNSGMYRKEIRADFLHEIEPS